MTRDGKGKSAKLIYHNANGDEKQFQLGNEISRGVFQVSKLLGPDNRLYLEKAMLALQVFGPAIKTPKVSGRQAPKKKVNLQRLQLTDMALAYNEMRDGDTCHAMHRDGASTLPTVISACPGTIPLLSSEEKHVADAGLLLHEIGGVVHGYGSRDLLIFSGNNLHGPLPPTPWYRNKEVRKKERDQASRESFVLFHK